jgi:hypothetical protein
MWKIQPQWVVTPRKQTDKQTNNLFVREHPDGDRIRAKHIGLIAAIPLCCSTN